MGVDLHRDTGKLAPWGLRVRGICGAPEFEAVVPLNELLVPPAHLCLLIPRRELRGAQLGRQRAGEVSRGGRPNQCGVHHTKQEPADDQVIIVLEFEQVVGRAAPRPGKFIEAS
jgi:hypothetical protein